MAVPMGLMRTMIMGSWVSVRWECVLVEINQYILGAAVLLILGIVASKFAYRMGLPVLVFFLAIGILAGQEGLVGIRFEDFGLANAAGTVALVIILFEGGLRTSFKAFRLALWPAVGLATIGVLLTALVTGLAAVGILGLTLFEGLLLGSIIGSTDAAAVFLVLQSRDVQLRSNLASLLEVESGANDPMAIFLTITFLQVLMGEDGMKWYRLLGFFAQQMFIGATVGVMVGLVAAQVMKRAVLTAGGLYSVLTGAIAFLAYGLAATVDGSGFLSVYLCGVIIGNSQSRFQSDIFIFHSGLAWMAQISMFVMLGLLSTPSQILAVASPGIFLALILIFISRPLAVTLTLSPFGFTFKEIVFVSWVGLKGAVPIILATFPLLFGHPLGVLFFNMVFFVVIISAVSQGWSLPWLAGVMGLNEVAAPSE